MSSGKGDSFEARIALILSKAGFTILERPHQVKLGDQTVGDLDVFAEEPYTHERIGVSCKEWFGATPGSQEFSHLVEMMEIENIKYGIFASAKDVAETMYARIEHTATTKGLVIFVLDSKEILKLEEWLYARRDLDIEYYFKEKFGFSFEKKGTIGDFIKSQHRSKGKTVECDFLIPINRLNEIPESIENSKILVEEESTLTLTPYLVMSYNLEFWIRHPSTGQVLEETKDNGTIIIDTIRGKVLDEKDELYKQIERNYTHAELHSTIHEDGFIVNKLQPMINVNEFVSNHRRKIASDNEIEARYTTQRGEFRTIQKRPRPEDVKILTKTITYLPTWNLKFSAGTKTYTRSYYAYDGKTINDNLSSCQKCNNTTVLICTTCYSTTCKSHRLRCKTCNELICTSCGEKCVVCKTEFCNEHKPQQKCGKCGHTVCSNCFTIACSECKILICNNELQTTNRFPCRICNRIICSNCGKSCADCKNGFCPDHLPQTHCENCETMLCDTCLSITCNECKKILCPKHRNKCIMCSSITCGSHEISKKYSVLKKKFCSQYCMSIFEKDYQTLGKFGKFKKLLK